MFPIVEVTKKLLRGGTVIADCGTKLYTPDGFGFYKALWGRDFAYILQSAGEFIPPEEMKAAIEFLIGGAREDGWIPDRREPDGVSRYTAGDEHFPASSNLDTGPFLVIAVDVYLRRLEAEQAKVQFEAWQNVLQRSLDCLPVDENGLIWNHAEPPHSPYGFTDCIVKTGKLAMETLLLWQALKIMADWTARCGQNAEDLEKKLRAIEAVFASTFTESNGMLLASTGCCSQIDVWACCYAVHIGFPLPEEQLDRISQWLIDHYDEVTEGGQIRHLPGGEFWEKTFVPVAPGEYQNGAYWATATEWFCSAVGRLDEELAAKTVEAALDYFEKYGIFECVNGEYRKLDTFVASATNVYAAAKRWLSL